MGMLKVKRAGSNFSFDLHFAWIFLSVNAPGITTSVKCRNDTVLVLSFLLSLDNNLISVACFSPVFVLSASNGR